MHADYWQRTNELSEAPRAEDHSLMFRSDQDRWLAPRIEDRWVLLRPTNGGIERRDGSGRALRKPGGKRLYRERPS